LRTLAIDPTLQTFTQPSSSLNYGEVVMDELVAPAKGFGFLHLV